MKVVLGLVSLSVFLMTPPDLGPRVTGARMTIANLTSDALKPNKFNATWVTGTHGLRGNLGFIRYFFLFWTIHN